MRLAPGRDDRRDSDVANAIASSAPARTRMRSRGCGSSISVDLRSEPVELRSQRVEKVRERRCDLNRRDHDDGHHDGQHGDPGPSGPTGQPRPRDKYSGRRPGLERRPLLRDDRRADPLLPANSHPHRFPSRADPPPRQAPGSAVPVIERLGSIIQIRRREQPPEQLLVSRSSEVHLLADLWHGRTAISNRLRSLAYGHALVRWPPPWRHLAAEALVRSGSAQEAKPTVGEEPQVDPGNERSWCSGRERREVALTGE